MSKYYVDIPVHNATAQTTTTSTTCTNFLIGELATLTTAAWGASTKNVFTRVVTSVIHNLQSQTERTNDGVPSLVIRLRP